MLIATNLKWPLLWYGIFLMLSADLMAKVACEGQIISQLQHNAAFNRLIEHRAKSVKIGLNGALDRNFHELSDVASQRSFLWLARYALMTKDADYLGRTLAAVQWGFEQQTEAGYFNNGLKTSPQRAITADLFFLQAVMQLQQMLSCVAGQEHTLAQFSPWRAPTQDALRWIVANQEELYRQDRRASNRILFDVLALDLGGRWVQDVAAQQLAANWLNTLLQSQTEQGVLLEKGGSDSSYQAVSALNLMILSLAHESLLLRQPIARAMQWEASRIEADGRISITGNTRTGHAQETFLGKSKRVNYFEVALAFFYWSQISEDDEYLRRAERIVQYMVHHT